MRVGRLDKIARVTIIAAALLVSVAALRVFFSSSVQREDGGPAPPRLLNETVWDEVLSAGVLVGGSADSSPVTVVEFMDLECPFCRQSYSAFANVAQEISDSVTHLFVHYPIESIHRFAMPAARALECADKEGRFADYMGVVFQKQDSLGLKTWVSYAVESGVQDTTRFNECTASREPLPRVERGLSIGRRIAIQGTPTVLINGWLLSDVPYSAEEYTRLIMAVLGGEEPLDP